jgi:Predicted transcriptional regulator with C-terminal CBS domains
MDANMIKGRIMSVGLTQEKVAVMVGMSGNSLSRKLTGKRDFTLSEVNAICKALDIADPTPYFFNAKIPNTQR